MRLRTRQEITDRDESREHESTKGASCFRAFAISFVFILLLAPATLPAQETATAAPPIRHRVLTIAEIPCVVQVLSIPLDAGYRLRSRLGGGTIRSKATLSCIVAAEPETPVAAFNSGYFVVTGPYGGDPIDLHMSGGRMRSTPLRQEGYLWADHEDAIHMGRLDLRPVLQLHAELPEGEWPERVYTVDGDPGNLTNRWAVYTPTLGTTVLLAADTTARTFRVEESWPDGRWCLSGKAVGTAAVHGGEVPIPEDGLVLATLGGSRAELLERLPEGTGLRFELQGADAGRVSEAVAGLPLVEEGRPAAWLDRETSDPRHPRTAVGLTEHELLVLVADGRQPGYSMGLTVHEEAKLLIDLGARTAVNLDGGGSSTLWFQGQVLNRPSDGQERPLADAMVVLEPEKKFTTESTEDTEKKTEFK